MGGTAWRVTSEVPRAVIVVRPPRTARWVRDVMVRHISTVREICSPALEFRLSIQQGLEAEAVARELHRIEIDCKTARDIMTPNPRTIARDAFSRYSPRGVPAPSASTIASEITGKPDLLLP